MHKEAVKELFNEVAGKIADRPGGYTRVIKTGFRKTDSAEMAIIELVDYNTEYTTGGSTAGKGGGKRSRRAGKKASTPPVTSGEEE